MCSYLSFDTDVIALDKSLTEHWEAAMINVVSEQHLSSLGIH